MRTGVEGDLRVFEFDSADAIRAWVRVFLPWPPFLAALDHFETTGEREFLDRVRNRAARQVLVRLT